MHTRCRLDCVLEGSIASSDGYHQKTRSSLSLYRTKHRLVSLATGFPCKSKTRDTVSFNFLLPEAVVVMFVLWSFAQLGS